MKRKLFSAMLSIFALLLLMGAAAVPEQPAALLAEEESAGLQDAALETEARSPDAQLGKTDSLISIGGGPKSGEDVEQSETNTPTEPEDSTAPDEPAEPSEPDVPEKPVEPVAPAPAVDSGLLIDGQPAPLELCRRAEGGTTFVSLSAIARQLDPAAQIGWDGGTMTVTTPRLSLTAQVGELYIVANGRYLYVPETVQNHGEGNISVPLRTVAKAFGATVGYNGSTGVVTVARGSGAIQDGDSFYNQDDLFWLSRVIHRESGNQPMEGRMAVGNVVLNRVADPAFPNTVEGVLAQKNQFSSYRTGAMANTKPSQGSVIAAKLVLDGGVVEETRGALFFDSTTNSWAARNKQHIATIGGHKFYG